MTVRKEIVELGRLYDAHFSREMEIIAEHERIGRELKPTLEEEEYLLNLMKNHPHVALSAKKATLKDFHDTVDELFGRRRA